MPDVRRKRRPTRRVTRTLWLVAVFFAIGYFPTVMLRSPVISMIVAACAVIPLASLSTGPLHGARRAVGFAIVAGVGMYSALTYVPAVVVPATQPTGPTTTAATGPTTSTAPRPQAASTAPGTQPATAPAMLPAGVRLRLAIVSIGGTIAMCAAIGLLFGQLARRRRQAVEDEWSSAE